MTKQEFIQLFVEQYGYLPDEESIQELFPTQPVRTPTQLSYLSGRRNRAKGEDLLAEIKDIFDDIASYAKQSANKPKHKVSKTWTTEFTYMALIFAAKAFLYFTLQNGYREGLDFSNL